MTVVGPDAMLECEMLPWFCRDETSLAFLAWCVGSVDVDQRFPNATTARNSGQRPMLGRKRLGMSPTKPSVYCP